MAKQRKIQISIIVVMLVMVSVFAHILLGDFRDGERDIAISLPSKVQGTTVQDPGGATPQVNTDLEQIVVTKENVQAVIASMSRPSTYHMTIKSKNHYGKATKNRTIDYWVKDGNSRTRTVSDGTIRNEVYWNDKAYLWNEGSTTYETYARGSFSSDASAGILTYEDVLAQDSSQIVEARYDTYNEIPCIYVAAQDKNLKYLYEYYVSLAEGLLIYGAVTKETTPIFTCDVDSLTVGVYDETVFALPPDYTILG